VRLQKVAVGSGSVAGLRERTVATGCSERGLLVTALLPPTYADNPGSGHTSVKLSRYLSEIRQSLAPRHISYLARSR
jgi:hypothetical protein